jgi:ribosomal protein L29
VVTRQALARLLTVLRERNDGEGVAR